MTGFEYQAVTSNTALSAGGTSVLTVASPWVNTGYTTYQLRGSNKTTSNVWRTYTIPNTYVSQHLVEQFNYSVPWSPSQGAVTETNFPTAVVCYSAGGIPLQVPLNFEVILYNGSTNGYIRFYEPVTVLNNSQTVLAQGGSSVVAPTDIQVLVPYSRGTLYAQYPASGYGGTAYTEFNVRRTLYRDYPSWASLSNLTAMQQLAQQVFATVSNTVQEGTITYYGQYSTALQPGTPIAISLASILGTTGYESLAAPCRTVTLEWPQAGAAEWVTRIQFSTRRQQFSGDRLYVHPQFSAGNGAAWQGFNLGQIGLPGGLSGFAADFAGQTASGQIGAVGSGAAGQIGSAAGASNAQIGQAGEALNSADQIGAGAMAWTDQL